MPTPRLRSKPTLSYTARHLALYICHRIRCRDSAASLRAINTAVRKHSRHTLGCPIRSDGIYTSWLVKRAISGRDRAYLKFKNLCPLRGASPHSAAW